MFTMEEQVSFRIILSEIDCIQPRFLASVLSFQAVNTNEHNKILNFKGYLRFNFKDITSNCKFTFI